MTRFVTEDRALAMGGDVWDTRVARQLDGIRTSKRSLADIEKPLPAVERFLRVSWRSAAPTLAFCLGVSSVGMSEEGYRHITYDLNMA